jgi:hypothetical protein
MTREECQHGHQTNLEIISKVLILQQNTENNKHEEAIQEVSAFLITNFSESAGNCPYKQPIT